MYEHQIANITDIHSTSTPGSAPRAWSGQRDWRLRLLAIWRFLMQSVWSGCPLSRLQAALLVSCGGIAQTISLAQSPLLVQTYDSAEYLRTAHAILQQGRFFDVLRTPGYPAFVALVLWLTGGHQLAFIAVAQTALMCAIVVEIAMLAYRLTRQSWATTICVLFIATNLYLLNWERLVLSEELSYWAVVTGALLFERILRTPRWPLIAGFGVFCGIMILIRPFFLYYPLLMAALLLAPRLKRATPRPAMASILVGLFLAYGIVLAYMAGNYVTNGLFAVSDVTNRNLFGKVIEYHMESEYTDARFAQMARDATAFDAHGGFEPVNFLAQYPQYGRNNNAMLGAYSGDVLRHHLFQYLVDSLPDMARTAFDQPLAYAGFSSTAPWVHALLALSQAELLLYALLPLVALWSLWRWWHQPGDAAALTVLALPLAIAGDLLTSGTGTYFEFYRMRSPFDWAMLLCIVVGGTALLSRLSAHLHLSEGRHYKPAPMR